MINISRIFSLVVCAALVLTGCGSGGGSSSAPPAPQYTMSTLPAGVLLPLTPHQGLEVLKSSSASPLVADPSASYLKTAVGFDLTSGQNTWSVDTRSGDTHYTIPPRGGMAVTQQTIAIDLTAGAPSNLDYATYGSWMITGFLRVVPEYGVFATGIQTTALQMPTTGSATYNGKVMGGVFAQSRASATYVGDISLTANFAGNAITGRATNLQATTIPAQFSQAPSTTEVMNDINLTAGTITGPSFSGTAATAAPQSGVTTYDVQGMTGQFGGKFYGPNAQELAGTLALTGNAPATGGPATAVGSFGAHR